MKKIMVSDKFGLTEAVLSGRKTQTRRIITCPKEFKGEWVAGFYIYKRQSDNAIIQWPCMYDADECTFDGGEILPKYKVGEVVAVAQSYKNPHRGRVYSIEGIAPCLNCNEGGQREVKILQRGHGYAKGGFFDIAPALTTSKWQDNNFAVIEYWIRKLTPRECFRLMDVPEHHINRLLNAGISNSQLYKLAGNSIVVACLYHIFRKMFCETAREYGAPTAHSQEIPDVQQLSLF